jgi:hypothetical protein
MIGGRQTVGRLHARFGLSESAGRMSHTEKPVPAVDSALESDLGRWRWLARPVLFGQGAG